MYQDNLKIDWDQVIKQVHKLINEKNKQTKQNKKRGKP